MTWWVDDVMMDEADLNERVREEVIRRGLPLNVINPWNWMHGSFEGIFVDQETGTLAACADPRMAGHAEGL